MKILSEVCIGLYPLVSYIVIRKKANFFHRSKAIEFLLIVTRKICICSEITVSCFILLKFQNFIVTLCSLPFKSAWAEHFGRKGCCAKFGCCEQQGFVFHCGWFSIVRRFCRTPKTTNSRWRHLLIRISAIARSHLFKRLSRLHQNWCSFCLSMCFTGYFMQKECYWCLFRSIGHLAFWYMLLEKVCYLFLEVLIKKKVALSTFS